MRVFSLYLLLLHILPSASATEKLLVDRIVAVVEDKVITMRELYAKSPTGMHNEGQDRVNQMLELMIDEAIIDREVASMRDQLGVTESEVDRAIDEIKRMNSISEDQLRDALYRQGMAWSEYRRKLRTQIERMRLIQMKVNSRVSINEQTVKAACIQENGGNVPDQVSLSHILISIPEGSNQTVIEEAYKKAITIKETIQKGMPFQQAVELFSDDKRAVDGDLGTFKKGQLFDEIDKIAFTMQKNEISEPVKTPLGWHLIKCTGLSYSNSEKCQDLQYLQEIKQKLYQEESERQMQAWIEQLKRKAYIERRL